jgi:hypothetical protein
MRYISGVIKYKLKREIQFENEIIIAESIRTILYTTPREN